MQCTGLELTFDKSSWPSQAATDRTAARIPLALPWAQREILGGCRLVVLLRMTFCKVSVEEQSWMMFCDDL